MMQRDEEGYIIEKLPETAIHLKGLENLVILDEGGLPEYTPQAYNSAIRYFRNLKLKFDIDHLSNEEWTDLTSGYEILEINGICKIAYKKENQRFAEDLSNSLKNLSPSDSYAEQINGLVILDVCIFTETSDVHVELPYCAIDQMRGL